MNRDDIKEIIRDVFGRNTQMEDIGEWVSIRCPLSPWTHERGMDGKPSAGISVKPTGVSIFSCFTCKNPGPISSLLRKYSDFSGENLDDLIEELGDEEYLGPRQAPTWEEVRGQKEVEILMPINEGIWMDVYDSAVGHPYLWERGISDATAERLELLFDPRDPADGEARILFPVRGYDGLLYGFTGRAINPHAKLKVRDYDGLAKAQLVLGAHLVAKDNPASVEVVEGLFDYARMHEMGYYGNAVMHANMTDAQADIFRTMGKPTYFFYDDDKAGDEGCEVAARKLRGYVPIMQVRYPRIEILDDSPEGFHMLKDPGELEAEEVAAMKADCRLA
ncbi:MAG: hypothetical protein RSE62_03215 [Citrobacter sp.]